MDLSFKNKNQSKRKSRVRDIISSLGNLRAHVGWFHASVDEKQTDDIYAMTVLPFFEMCQDELLIRASFIAVMIFKMPVWFALLFYYDACNSLSNLKTGTTVFCLIDKNSVLASALNVNGDNDSRDLSGFLYSYKWYSKKGARTEWLDTFRKRTRICRFELLLWVFVSINFLIIFLRGQQRNGGTATKIEQENAPFAQLWLTVVIQPNSCKNSNITTTCEAGWYVSLLF